ncbi:MAG: hypothetical protein IJR02_00280 [Bacteroidaceae bacterium]|nr:hypothetical protein [Bacteroidaceae bacterium]MBQ7460745.1 hypothetical protein [Bacteroidaceae bacterium]
MKTKLLLLFTVLTLMGVNMEASAMDGMKQEPSMGQAGWMPTWNSVADAQDEEDSASGSPRDMFWMGWDLTGRMVNFDYSIGLCDGWTIEGSKEFSIGGTEDHKCCGYWARSTFNMYQVVENLPAGEYEVEVHGFYRYLGLGYAWLAYKNQTNDYVKEGGAPVSFYVNDKETPFTNVFEEPVPYGTLYNASDLTGTFIDKPLEDGEGHWYPNGHYNAALAFDAGLYKMTIACRVEEGESLRIGIKGATNQMFGFIGSWACWSKFKLIKKDSGEEEEPEKNITLYVDEDNSETIDENDEEVANVTIEGLSMQSDQWNTFCVPFDLTEAQIEETLGEGADVEALVGSSYNEETQRLHLDFEPRTVIEAGMPYVVKVAADVEDPVFNQVTVNNIEPITVTTTCASMTGSYSPTPLTEGDKNTLYVVDNQFVYPTTATTLPATKCWFTLLGTAIQDNSSNGIKGVRFAFKNSPATGIFNIKSSLEAEDESWYTLQGVRVTTPQKGIYIYKGKKVFMK